jgi:PAS domain S-box-containing protein
MSNIQGPPNQAVKVYRIKPKPDSLTSKALAAAHDPGSRAAGLGGNRHPEILPFDSCFKAIAENANDGIVINTSVHGPYVYANQRAGDISGYTVPELLQINPEKLLSPKEYEQVMKILERRLNGRSFPERYETQIVHKAGKTVPVEISGSSTIWDGKPAALLLIRDVSLRKLIEGMLSRMNAELKDRVREQAARLADMAVLVDRSQSELARHKEELERANRELAQTNSALSVLARNIDKKSLELENKIARTVCSQMIPLVTEIQRDKIPEKARAKLEVLATYLRDLTPRAAKGRDVIISLSSMELRIAVMIKKGFSTDQIARLLCISTHTVKTHRKAIRRKLNIQNAQVNLSSYLKLKLS